jgi:hypothetical protein
VSQVAQALCLTNDSGSGEFSAHAGSSAAQLISSSKQRSRGNAAGRKGLSNVEPLSAPGRLRDHSCALKGDNGGPDLQTDAVGHLL